MATYWEKLRDPRWQKRRLEIMQRDDFTCRMCSAQSETLHVHHLRYSRGSDPWESADRSLITVCESCHAALHDLQFGSSVLESLVAGGADIILLMEFDEALRVLFIEGPDGRIEDFYKFSKAIDKMYAAFQVAQDPVAE